MWRDADEDRLLTGCVEEVVAAEWRHEGFNAYLAGVPLRSDANQGSAAYHVRHAISIEMRLPPDTDSAWLLWLNNKLRPAGSCPGAAPIRLHECSMTQF